MPNALAHGLVSRSGDLQDLARRRGSVPLPLVGGYRRVAGRPGTIAFVAIRSRRRRPPRDHEVAHMEERLSRGRGCWPLSGWWWLLLWLRLAGRSGRPRVRDGGHAHIRGLGTPRPWFVARPPSKVERGARLGVAQATFRGVVVREAGDARAASLAATGCEFQRELVSLLRVVGVCLCGSEAVCVRGSPAGMDAGGTGSG
jgi:hypothetical protein